MNKSSGASRYPPWPAAGNAAIATADGPEYVDEWIVELSPDRATSNSGK
jgi:hypothetical protein